MKLNAYDLRNNLIDNKIESIEVWACAYSTTRTKENMALKCPPVKGILTRNGFCPYNKNGKLIKSKWVNYSSRNFFDNENECKAYYNDLIQQHISSLIKLINVYKKDLI